MRVHFLGCGDAFGSGGRNHSAYLIDSPPRLILLDCGPTALLAMKRAGFEPSRLDAVILSHLHGDHFGGLPFLFLDFLYERPRKSPLLIGGPPGTEERVRALTQCMYPGGSGSRELPPTLFRILQPDQRESFEGIDVLPFRVPHQVEEVSLGLLIQIGDKRVLYSGDSTWTDRFIAHAGGVDLFICECTFFQGDSPGHMVYERIRDKLPLLDCKRTVLTHLGREMLARRGEIPFETAEDGMVVEI